MNGYAAPDEVLPENKGGPMGLRSTRVISVSREGCFTYLGEKSVEETQAMADRIEESYAGGFRGKYQGIDFGHGVIVRVPLEYPDSVWEFHKPRRRSGKV